MGIAMQPVNIGFLSEELKSPGPAKGKVWENMLTVMIRSTGIKIIDETVLMVTFLYNFCIDLMARWQTLDRVSNPVKPRKELRQSSMLIQVRSNPCEVTSRGDWYARPG